MEDPNQHNNAISDKIEGMLLGAALGDAIGAPHEFRKAKIVYTGRLESPITRINQWQGKKVSAIGQITDDTEMIICLLKTICDFGGSYNKENAIQNYLNWANSQNCCFMGKNTRNLFKGVRTINGYERRYEQYISSKPQTEWTQSNGCLMRCAPMVLLALNHSLDYCLDMSDIDCGITNPHPINIEINRIYLTGIYNALNSKSKEEIIATMMEKASIPLVIDIMNKAKNGVNVDISGNDKGWALYGLYCTVYGLINFIDYKTAIDSIILLKGDTDTNACIAGALLGAFYGHNKMRSDPITSQNLTIMKSCDVTTGDINRNPEYTIASLLTLIETTKQIFK